MNVSKAARCKLILALDVKDIVSAQHILEQVGPLVGMVKVGMRFVFAHGLDTAIHLVQKSGSQAFVDLKPYDIGNTICEAVDVIAERGAAALTIHIENGYHNLADAIQASRRSIKSPYPELFGVTVLTDKTSNHLFELGIKPPPLEPERGNAELQEERIVTHQVLKLARIAQMAGLPGLIASPKELVALRSELSLKDMKIWTPGVRPTWAPSNDQKRTLTPYEAICAGADAVIVGRPILQPPKGMTPVDAALKILEEIERALDTSPQDPGPIAA